MKWKTLEFDELAQEPMEHSGDININIFLGESFRENLDEVFNAVEKLKQEEQIENIKNNENTEDQEDLTEILDHIGPRIP